MGQFTVRPEEPAEWAGLPSEPRQAGPAVEALAAPVESADPIDLLGGATRSVVIRLTPGTETGAPEEAGEADPSG